MTEERNRRAHAHVTPAHLAHALHLPLGTEIVGAEWDFLTESIMLHVRHTSLMEIPSGHLSPHVRVYITEYVDTDRLVPERTYSSVFR